MLLLIKGCAEFCAQTLFFGPSHVINFLWPIFNVNIVYYDDIRPPRYIECNFGADFSLKLQNLILCYCLKKGIKYHIETF